MLGSNSGGTWAADLGLSAGLPPPHLSALEVSVSHRLPVSPAQPPLLWETSECPDFSLFLLDWTVSSV